jgi:TM2 domain-containing membrane protein YozV
MNCAVHTDTPAVAFCRTCGKALCENCKRDVMGIVYCEPCLAARLHGAAAPATGAPAAAPVAPLPGTPSPAIALLLGFIPGVGAMYNGQFMKAFVHVVIFILAILATNNLSDFFGFLIAFWVIYMAFDAYKTAEAKRLGLPLPDPLGLDRMLGIQESQPAASAGVPPAAMPAGSAPAGVPSGTEGVPPMAREGAPTAAIVLIGLGVLFLLSNLGFFNMRFFWPLFLIGLGLWIAYKRTMPRPQP